jgi:ribonuclease D
VQLALPGKDDEGDAVLVDPLAEGLSLDPLLRALPKTRAWSRCFTPRARTWRSSTSSGGGARAAFRHAGGGDGLRLRRAGGLRDAGARIARPRSTRSSRFTDWSRRPLSEAQKTYALADVTHLRQIYEHLQERLASSGRSHWMEEELGALTDASSYVVEPPRPGGA